MIRRGRAGQARGRARARMTLRGHWRWAGPKAARSSARQAPHGRQPLGEAPGRGRVDPREPMHSRDLCDRCVHERFEGAPWYNGKAPYLTSAQKEARSGCAGLVLRHELLNVAAQLEANIGRAIKRCQTNFA